MAGEVKYGTQPFAEAVEYFRGKVNLPTEHWTDLWEGMHARAFVIAGAQRDGLLSDFRQAIDKAISQGTTIQEFRKDFDATVKRHGWSYKGGRNWRSRVIYDTNLTSAYNAGRYKQMTDPHILKRRPYWRYRHGDSQRPRPHHLAWDGTVLPADSEWFDAHYPQNGWGCSCFVEALSKRDLERQGLSGPTPVPSGKRSITLPNGKREVLDLSGTKEWTNPTTGEVRKVPVGIDPGWAYNPGKAAWGSHLSQQVMDNWRSRKGTAWEPLTPGNWESYGRPPRLPVNTPQAELGPASKTRDELRANIETALGAPARSFAIKADGVTLPVHVDAAVLARHLDLARSPFVTLLPEMLMAPSEVWLSFERHKGTGKVELRTRIFKAVAVGKDRILLLVAQAVDGQLEAWTFIPSSDFAYGNRQRRGRLLFGE